MYIIYTRIYLLLNLILINISINIELGNSVNAIKLMRIVFI